jgi:hypothetical protein
VSVHLPNRMYDYSTCFPLGDPSGYVCGYLVREKHCKVPIMQGDLAPVGPNLYKAEVYDTAREKLGSRTRVSVAEHT